MDDAAAERERLAEKLRIALVLSDDGFEMKRQQLHSRNPEASEAEIERLFGEWLRERPGAEHGDGIGHPISWPLRRP